MSYTIIFSDNKKEPLIGLSFDEAFTFKQAHFSEVGDFLIKEEGVKEPRVKKPKTESQKETEKIAFRRTLTQLQQQEIADGVKKMKYNDSIGWYIARIDREEKSFNSPAIEAKRKEDIVKGIILEEIWTGYRSAIYETVSQEFPLLQQDDFEKLLKRLKFVG